MQRVRNEIIKEVFEGIQKKAVDETAELEDKKTGEPDLMRSWEKAGKKRTKWQSSGRGGANIGVNRGTKKDRSSLNLDAMQKVLELVVNERMS